MTCLYRLAPLWSNTCSIWGDSVWYEDSSMFWIDHIGISRIFCITWKIVAVPMLVIESMQISVLSSTTVGFRCNLIIPRQRMRSIELSSRNTSSFKIAWTWWLLVKCDNHHSILYCQSRCLINLYQYRRGTWHAMVSGCSKPEYQISEDTLTTTAVSIDSIVRCTRVSWKETERTLDVKSIVVDLGHAYSDLHQQSYPLGGSLLGAYSATMIQKKTKEKYPSMTCYHYPPSNVARSDSRQCTSLESFKLNYNKSQLAMEHSSLHKIILSQRPATSYPAIVCTSFLVANLPWFCDRLSLYPRLTLCSGVLLFARLYGTRKNC